MAGRPKMCGSCGKLMGVAEVCPYCGADQKKLGVRLRQAARGQKGHASVTVVLLGTNVFLFLVAIAVGGLAPAAGALEILAPDTGIIWKLGMQDNSAIAAGDWWRIILPIFLHLGLLHVAFNCYLLWITGRWIEADFGPVRMFVIYMTAGIVGFVLSYFAGIPGAGASGSVSGLLGAVLVRRWLVDRNFRHPITLWVLQLIVLNVILGFAFPMINNVAHGGGFVAGAALSWGLTKAPTSRGGNRVVALTAGVLALTTVVAFALMLLSLGRPGPEQAISANACFEQSGRAITDAGRSVSPASVKRALECFDELGELSGGFGDHGKAVQQRLREAGMAHNALDLRAEQDATTQLEVALKRYEKWLIENHQRFGLRMQ